MVTDATIQRYETSLTNLLRVTATHHARNRGLHTGLDAVGAESDVARELMRAVQPAVVQRQEAVASQAEEYLAAADSLERELAESAVPEASETGAEAETAAQLAALMSGDWLAATALTIAVGHAPSPPSGLAEIDSDRRALLVGVPTSEDLARLLESTNVDLEDAVLLHGLDHDAADVFLGLRGVRPVAGGASDPVDDSVEHVLDGLVRSVNAIGGSAAMAAVVPSLGHLVTSFVHRTPLDKLAQSAGGAVRRLHRLVVRALNRAVRLARKLLGRSNTRKLEDWVRDEVLGLARQAEVRLARKLLKVEKLEETCATALTGLTRKERTQRLHALDAVGPSFDQWSKWGKTGARWLTLAPATLLGPAYAPVIGVAVLALLAYELWVAVDHLDWPALWLPDHVVGVRRAVTR